MVARGALLAPSVTRRLLDRFAGTLPAAPPADLEEFTAREVEVLRLVSPWRCRTRRSPSRLVLTEATVRRTCPRSCASSACATACRPSSSPTTSVSCARAPPEDGGGRPCSRPMRAPASGPTVARMIEAQGLGKRYGDTIAVERLTFAIRPGIVHGLLGPNGAGKSTTLRLILGLDRPTAGTVTVAGHAYRARGGAAARGRRAARRQGRARQAHGPRAPALAGRGRRAPALARGRVLDQVGLRRSPASASAASRSGCCSGSGSRRRCSATRAPCSSTSRSTASTPRASAGSGCSCADLAADGRTVVISSHLMSEVEATADHVLVIGRGRLLADMSVRDFTQQSASSHLRVVSPDAGALGRLVERAGGRVTVGGTARWPSAAWTPRAWARSRPRTACGRTSSCRSARASRRHSWSLTRDSVEYRAEVAA